MTASEARRVVVTGMSVVTPLGDTVDAVLEGMMTGRSAIKRWRSFDTSRIAAKIGGDLADRPALPHIEAMSGRVPQVQLDASMRVASRSPWSTAISIEVALRAAVDAGLFDAPPKGELDGAAVVVAGHNINVRYRYDSHALFAQEPDFVDAKFIVYTLDTDHAGAVSECLGLHGGASTVGAACASGNHALRAAVDEIRHHERDCVLVVGALLDYSPMDLHALVLLGATPAGVFDDAPERASRPFDVARAGFLPAHGAAALVVESLESARGRGARIWAEVIGVESASDACRLPRPSVEGQVRTLRRVLSSTGVRPEQIGYVNAHATSTPKGDVAEATAIRSVFGPHADRLPVNAPKSFLGHTCWSAATVEAVTAIASVARGVLYPCANLDEVDPAVDLDLVRAPRKVDVDYFLKNAFGFGGLNSIALFRRWHEGGRP